MKITFNEYEHGADFQMIPETPEEVGMLLRLGTNAKQQAPSITVYFSKGVPDACIWFEKVKPGEQTNTLTAKRNSRIRTES